MYRFGSLFKIAFLSTGRRMFALAKLQRLAQARGDTGIADRARMALEHDRGTRQLDLAWAGVRRGERGDPRTRAADTMVDQSLAGLRNGAQAAVQGAASDDPLHPIADEFLARVFPAGLKDLVQQPFVDELASVEAIVELLRGELAGHVAQLGLTRHAQRLMDRVDEYRAALEADSAQVDFPEVREARAIGHDLLLGVIALVLSTYYLPRDEDHAEARAELLGPILEQDEIVRALRRARRRVVDIDPDTGEPDETLDVDDEPEADADSGDASQAV